MLTEEIFQLELTRRPRRNRRTAAIRSLVAENTLKASDLVMPYFLLEGESRKVEIGSMPGIYRMTIDHVVRDMERLHARGVPGVILFPVVPDHLKDNAGTYGFDENGILPQAIRILKQEIPSVCVMADLALDPFSSMGHDGVAGPNQEILNDLTVKVLSEIALLYAEAGADYIAPSDMMDGRIGAIRRALDAGGYTDVGIVSYCAKYASSLYAPFRDALSSAPRFGDKLSYQMNPANSREALIEALLDEQEGADILMVKPALHYLDIISLLKQKSSLPLSAYHVSGEYAMVMAAHEKGYLDAGKVFHEAHLAIKRAGADFIFTYAVHRLLERLN